MTLVASGSGRVVVSGLGVVQILAWGSSYYLLAVLATPIAAELGWRLSVVVGGLSVGLLMSGLAAPFVGRLIHARGGRPVLAVGAVAMAAGQVLLGASESLPVFFAAWLIIGCAMAASLYDAAFSTLGRLYGAGARTAITGLTLFGGFASTLCWPFSAYLVELLGWRGACFAYAAIQLALSLPTILTLIPREAARETAKGGDEGSADCPLSREERRLFLILAAILVLVGSIVTLLSAHLLAIFQAKGLALVAAVSLGAFVGPSQVTARLVEMALGRRYHAVWTMAASAALILAGTALLGSDRPLLFAAILLYGAGNGIGSIARGTVPLALFGPARYPILMGRLAMPALIAQAAAPFVGALFLEAYGAPGAIGFVTLLAVMNAALVGLLIALRPRQMP